MATTPQDMIEAINTCIKLDDNFELTEWEEEFVINIEERLEEGKSLTAKQMKSLQGIYDRT